MKLPATQRLLLVDGYGLIYRAFYAIRSLSTSKGRPTNAVYGFFKMLRKTVDELNPTHVGIVMDKGEPEERLRQLPTYKIQRKPMPDDLRPQIPTIETLVPLCGLHLLQIHGVEADDIIAALTDRAAKQKLPVIIQTSDKDLMQLVGAGVEAINPAIPDVRLDAAAVRERYGVEPRQIVDLLTLMGDAVDNIPGVPGIGAKTARALIQQFGSLDELLRRMDEIKKPKLLETLRAHLDLIEFNRKFVALDLGVPLPWSIDSLKRRPPDYRALDSLLEELEFRGLRKEIAAEAAKLADPQLGLGGL